MFNPFRPKTVWQPSSEELAAEEQVSGYTTPDLPPVAPAPPLQAPAAVPPPPPAAVAAPAAVPPAPAPQRPMPAAAAPAAGAAPLSTTTAQALEQLVVKLPGLLFAGLTEIETGVAVRGRTPSDILPAAPIARFHAELVRLERLALKHAAKGTAPEELREILVTISDQLHLLRVVRDGQLLLSIVLDPRLSSLPTARVALQAAANTIG